jgi:hypothetical protein
VKTRTFVSILILILAILIISEGYATDRKSVSDKDFFEVWSGTWINTDYGGDLWVKIITYPDGTVEGFGILTSTTASFKKKITILDKWLDSKGTIWYRYYWECLPPFRLKGYEMGKISDSGNTLEYISASEDYPIEEWEPDKFEYNYKIRYRQ